MKASATEIKNYFGKFLEMCKDEDILITKNDRVVAKLISYEDPSDGYLMLREGSAAFAYSAKKLSYEDFLRMTENNAERYEYIEGEIYLMSSPGLSHQLIHANIFAFFVDWFKGQNCRVFSAPFDVTLARDDLKSKNVVQPDLLISCDYQDKHDENDRYTGIPTLVIEIVSPQTRNIDYVKKLNVYLDGGVSEYWVVDPRDRKVTRYNFVDRQLEEMILFKHPEIVKSMQFAGLEIPTAEIFRD